MDDEPIRLCPEANAIIARIVVQARIRRLRREAEEQNASGFIPVARASRTHAK